MSENFEQRVNGLRSPSCVADKNANKIACKKKRPSRVNYGAGVFESVDESERTLEQDSNLVFGNDGGTQSEPSLLGSVAQEETGDCTDQETLMMNIGSPCTTSAVTQLQTYPNLKEQSCLLGDGTAVTSMQDANVLASVPYSPNANVREFDKHTFHTPFGIKVAIEEASDPTHMEVETTVLRRPQAFDESLEPMLDMSEDILTVSFPSFPSVFCDEMHMRTNSFVSCTAENPQSTSILETSQVAQTSSDVFSGLTRPPHEMPDICKGTSSIFTEEMDCVDLPPPIVGSKSEMEKTWLNDKRNCVSEHAHCSVPDQNSEQHMECEAHNARVSSPEAPQRAPLSLERESKIVVSDSAQSSTPNVQTTPIIQNYEDTFSFGMHNGAGRCTTSTPILQSKNATFFVSELEDMSETIKPVSIEFGYGNENLDSKTKKRFLTAASKTRKPDVINFPKPNFNNIKPRVMTRSAMLSKESHAEKNSPRSPQSGSAASSPLTSPRMALLSTRLGKRAAVEQDLKLETVMVRLHQQAPNKHTFASNTANVAACSKHLLSKAPRTGSAFKQSRGDVDRGSSTNSAVSSASTVACIQSFKMPENKTERPKVPPKPNHLTTKQKVLGLNECNLPPRLTNQDLVKPLARNDRSEVAPKVRDASLSGHAGFEPSTFGSLRCHKHALCLLSYLTSRESDATINPVSIKVTSATGKIVQKENASNLRSTTALKATTIKQKVQSSETGKHDSISKNISTNGILSPRQNNQPVSNGLDSSTPKEKPAVKALAAIAAKTQILRAFPKSRLPCKESTIQRTASLSSVDSSQSRHSANSVRSTGTNSLKNGKAPAAACRSKSVSTPPAAKALVSRIKVQPLRIIQTGLRGKSSALCEGAPRSAGLRKTDGKINSHIGITGPNAARYASVEKSKPKASPKTPYTPTQISEEKKSIEFAQCRSKCEKQSGIIVQLKQLVASGNQRFEALTVVIQQLLKEREEILRQRRAFSQELISLRGDLVTSSSTCERLEKEKNELQAVYEGILEKLKDQHQLELEELEEKLKEFYTDQCEKLKNAFFEEAEKYKLELQGKVDELNATHEQFRLEIEKHHVDTVKQIEVKHENTLSELKAAQEHERTVLEDSLTEKQDLLQKSINELKTENESLREKLKTEAEQRKLAKEKIRKNSQIMYLEQELESLKAVMEIKNEKLHQQDKKLMQVEKLVDNNATLFEKLKKSQQENEDLKARMDKHMALSRQLSTEQAVLQESLEKESKVNKRLSMENEELLWKLHNGDLCSPKKLSPTSPIPFQSSRSTGSFSSPTVSPR